MRPALALAFRVSERAGKLDKQCLQDLSAEACCLCASCDYSLLGNKTGDKDGVCSLTKMDLIQARVTL